MNGERLKFRAIVLLALLAGMPAAAQAQDDATGIWRAGGGRYTLTLALRADGPTLTGAASGCGAPPVRITEGRVEGRTITFKCVAEAVKHTLTLTGVVDDAQIAFTWKMDIHEGGRDVAPANTLFGASAPRTFVAKRVSEGDFTDLIALAEGTRTIEVTASVNLRPKDVKANGVLLVGQQHAVLRGAIIVHRRMLGASFYDTRALQDLAHSQGFGLVMVGIHTIANPVRITADVEVFEQFLRKLGEESGHPELSHVPLLFWGHSAGVGLGAAFAEVNPDRTIGLVAYHNSLRVSEKLKNIPALLIAGGNDPNAANVDAAWRTAQSAGAPWTYAFESDAVHSGFVDLEKASPFMITWMGAVLKARLSTDPKRVRPIDMAGGWLGNVGTADAMVASVVKGRSVEFTWLPDEATTRAWLTLHRPPQSKMR